MGSTVSKLVFQPPDASYSKDPNLIWLHTSESEMIPAFFIDRNARFTILFSHGNAEDLGMIIYYFKEVSHILEVNIFAYEYTGYGMSTGVPSEKALYADIDAAYRYVTDVIGVPWHDIILYGRSLGSGPSCHLAAKSPVRGLVLQSPILSAYRVGFNLRFTLPGDSFANIDKVPRVNCPVYIVHGTRDEIVPIWHGQELCRNCKIPTDPFWVEGGGHNNLEVMAKQPFFDRLIQFIRMLETTSIENPEQETGRELPVVADA